MSWDSTTAHVSPRFPFSFRVRAPLMVRVSLCPKQLGPRVNETQGPEPTSCWEPEERYSAGAGDGSSLSGGVGGNEGLAP
ncbi:MAG: hypothetical protein K0R38_1548 [Polyangiaceae bacterium]|jgi:hypothetical protein|nr:hypothetical protein [Polyangiaceae bacterium]